MNEGGDFTLVYKSQVVDNNLNPTWQNIRIPYLTLCNGDDLRKIRIEIFDHNRTLEDKFMGFIETSYGDILSGSKVFEIIESGGDKRGAILTVNKVELEQVPTFLDHLAAGTEINLIVGIDFTNSNGSDFIGDDKSLHYIGGDTHNPYEQAIASVGKVLEDYDTDKKYPVYGFGAKIRKESGGLLPTQHDFPLSDSDVHGIDGILQAYRYKVPQLSFSGPTYFAPLLEKIITNVASETAAAPIDAPIKYHVLLIITDGAVDDLDGTKEKIIAASRLPISIIIIGVGSEDFASKLNNN